MNSVIKDILKRKVNIEDKRNALNSIEKDIEIAKKNPFWRDDLL